MASSSIGIRDGHVRPTGVGGEVVGGLGGGRGGRGWRWPGKKKNSGSRGRRRIVYATMSPGARASGLRVARKGMYIRFFDPILSSHLLQIKQPVGAWRLSQCRLTRQRKRPVLQCRKTAPAAMHGLSPRLVAAGIPSTHVCGCGLGVRGRELSRKNLLPIYLMNPC